jgi:tetratricopeptide (TPR) repeat protein
MRVTRGLAALVALAAAAPAAAQPAPTFSRDVAPILLARCAPCHRPGGTAPFSLLTYADVRPRATLIARLTRDRVMPPWKVEPGYGEFVGESRLTDAEVGVIQQWTAGGAVEGSPADLPATPEWVEGWQLGQPDLVVTAPAYTLGPEGRDVFRIFVEQIPLDRGRFVTGFEFRPGNPRVVHHANIRLDRTENSARLDAADPEPGYSGLLARTAGYPEGYLLSWTPGQVPLPLPPGMSWPIETGTDLVIELHLQPTGRPETVEPSVGFFFTDAPPARIPTIIRLGRQDIDIPAGEPRHDVTDSFVIPVDVEVQAIQPHAHYRAREIRGEARLPDGSTRPLIYIRNWDFTWQQVYRYVTPVSLPRGTLVSMHYTYDNSPGNPLNDLPPRRVRWGQRSSDEMGDLWLQVLTRDERDRQALVEAFRPKMIAEDIVGYEVLLEDEPDSVALHDDAALLYLEAGRPADAVAHFAASARLAPQSAAAQFNLGAALTMAGRVDEAMTQYRAALALRPEYSQAHNNLAGLLLRSGRVEEAQTHFEAAIAADPGNADAHDNLGRLLRARGHRAEAIVHFRHAVDLRPDWPPALADLAWGLATSPEEALRDPAEAVRLAERAVVAGGGRDPGALDVLAAAYAAAGDFARAVTYAEAAVRLAPDVPAWRQRLALYQQGQAYRVPE